MFSKTDKYPYCEVLDGVRLRALAHGTATQMVEFLLDSNKELPLHDHPYEQTGYLIRGAMELQIGDESFILGLVTAGPFQAVYHMLHGCLKRPWLLKFSRLSGRIICRMFYTLVIVFSLREPRFTLEVIYE